MAKITWHQIEHPVIAIAIQLALFYSGLPLIAICGIAGALLFVGREEDSAEHRGIQSFYDNQRAKAPWYVGFEPRSWNLKSVLDFVLPIVATALFAIFFSTVAL